ncbi:hypothetical protein GE09DRAFT_1211540 [Coniochaeta sp. 2T2.1]|nr:hypothetical protein GE09DRAFT_1211540 [Coniochaeta sp. 2T2.1]
MRFQSHNKMHIANKTMSKTQRLQWDSNQVHFALVKARRHSLKEVAELFNKHFEPYTGIRVTPRDVAYIISPRTANLHWDSFQTRYVLELADSHDADAAADEFNARYGGYGGACVTPGEVAHVWRKRGYRCDNGTARAVRA